MIKESWREIKGYEGLYEVSNKGRVKSLERRIKNKNGYRLKKETIKALHSDRDGYKGCGLYFEGRGSTKKVHRLVAEAFIFNVNNRKEINHLDGDKTNNNVHNLEWCTRSENLKHAYNLGLIKCGNDIQRR